jgi:predicted Fe-S protein YdhL (DUF1289 family)
VTPPDRFSGDDAVVPSPCVDICHLDLATDLCVDCFRTRDEVGTWLNLSADERRRVLARVEMRRAAAPPRAP